MKTAYLHAAVLDGTESMKQRDDCTVLVEDGKITAVGAGIPAPEGFEIIDLTGCWLMPGLINLHVHLPGSGAPKKKQQDAAKAAGLVMKNSLTRKVGLSMCESYAKTELLSGVTTIRTVGGLGEMDRIIRDTVNSGKLIGPRMLVCNTAVSVPGGHMAGSVAYPAKDAADAADFVRKTIAQKPDWIKLMITGGVLDAKVRGEPGVLKMAPEIIRTCADEAHEAGYRVAAHVESPEGVRAALENGVNTVEHGAALTPELIRLFQEHGAADVCTISPAIPQAFFGPELLPSTDLTRYNGGVVLRGIVDCAKSCLEAGIPVGLGTDTACPYVTHYDLWRELEYFRVLVGVSPAFALYSATLGNAKILGIERETGSVEIGKSADFMATRKDPLSSFTALRSPCLVSIRGKVLREPKIKKFNVCERELDKVLQTLTPESIRA